MERNDRCYLCSSRRSIHRKSCSYTRVEGAIYSVELTLWQINQMHLYVLLLALKRSMMAITENAEYLSALLGMRRRRRTSGDWRIFLLEHICACLCGVLTYGGTVYMLVCSYLHTVVCLYVYSGVLKEVFFCVSICIRNYAPRITHLLSCIKSAFVA
jgi:hypothetical protein